MKKIIKAKNVLEAKGPYSHAVVVGDLCFTSGQLPIDYTTEKMELDDVKVATRYCLNNIQAICEELGKTLNDVVKCTVYVKDINEYAQVNEIYQEYFTNDFPARTAFQVGALPFGVPVEIEAIIDISK
ncbi:MAG: RidA family protein [Mycoplasmatales bacterium]